MPMICKLVLETFQELILFSGPSTRVCNKKLIFLFLNQNISFGYSKELSK